MTVYSAAVSLESVASNFASGAIFLAGTVNTDNSHEIKQNLGTVPKQVFQVT
jgi:hypothetical protein